MMSSDERLQLRLHCCKNCLNLVFHQLEERKTEYKSRSAVTPLPLARQINTLNSPEDDSLAFIIFKNKCFVLHKGEVCCNEVPGFGYKCFSLFSNLH